MVGQIQSFDGIIGAVPLVLLFLNLRALERTLIRGLIDVNTAGKSNCR